jgi:uncharacterized protein DUF6603
MMNANLEDIYALLAGRVTAARELLLEGGLFNELGQALTSLERTDLLLKEAEVAFADREITVRGKTDLLKLTGLSARIDITGETQRRFCLKFELPPTWHFQESFAALHKSYKKADNNPGLLSLQSSIVDDFRFSKAAFVFQNFDDGPLRTGLNFSGVISNPAPFAYLEHLFKIGEKATLQGPVRLKGDEAPDLNLKFGFTNTPFGLGHAVQVKEIACQIRTTPAAEGEQEAQTRLELIAGFEIGRTDPVPISAMTPLFSGAPIFSFATEFDGDGLNISRGVNALIEFAGGTNVDFKLPEALLLDRFGLKHFALVADTDPALVRHIQLTVASGQSWSIARDIKITGLRFGWLILFPFNKARAVSATVSGTLMLSRGNDQVLFDITASHHDDFLVTGSLREGTTIHLAKLIEVALGLTPGKLPALDIDYLEIEASTNGDFSVEGNLKSDWSLPIGSKTLALKQISLSFSRENETKKGTLSAVLEVGRAALQVTASVPESGDGFLFEGGTFGDDQQLDLTKVGDYLFSTFGVSLPSSLPHVVVSKLTTTFNTATNEFTFVAKGSFEVDDKQVAIILNIKITKNPNGSYTGDFSGQIAVGSSIFNLIFSKKSSSKVFVGTYRNTDGAAVSLRSFIDNISSNVASLMPQELNVELKNVLFGFRKNGEGKFLFGVQFGTRVRLSDLPLVGKDLPADKNVSVDGLRLLVTSAGLNAEEIGEVNELIPADIAQLPVGKDADKSTTGGEVIAKGLTISAQMNFGGTSKELIMQVGGKRVRRSNVDELSAASESLVAPATDNVKWFPLQKTFGPVFFDKVGVQYEAATLRFLLNAALSAAGLTLSLDGLSIGSSLSKFKPEFELRGLGIDYKAGDIEIGGAFLRTITPGKPDSYDGAAVIKTKQFAVSALGSYTTLEGEPSLFIYAFVDYPLGGPAFFFITGLAAGFGYNRRLIAPSVEKVAEFPLVKQAVEGKKAKPKDVMAALTSLQSHVPPNVGSIFLAVGVRFNSFKLIDSFALLTIEFGNSLAINLIGLSKAVVPTPVDGKAVTPLAQVEIAWKATYNPDDGCLGIDARLTPNSYILSKDCRLSGGYAFYSWFTGPNAGDFVQTLGGYHPKFKIPDHYPRVPRLAFDWRVNSSLTIQGDAYYALTGSALMAGGHLQVLFKEGELRAWLKLGADFLIAWKPYHYDAAMYVSVGASYTFNINLLFTRVRVTISVEVGANLHLWGPDFSGSARIDLSVISFTIAFGAGASQAPKRIETWTEFQKSFLPSQEDVCTISVKSGLVRNIQAKGSTQERWVINPKQFALMIDSAIPIKSMGVTREKLKDANIDFGIAPMTVRKEKPAGSTDPNIRAFTNSNLTIDIKKNGVTVTGKQFKYSPIKKLVPAGLWGESATPSLTGTKFLEDVATGIEIVPGESPKSGETKNIAVEVFKFKDEPYRDDFKWQRGIKFVPSDKKIADSVVSNQLRDTLLATLGLNFDISIGKTVADDFLTAPQIGTLEPCQPK